MHVRSSATGAYDHDDFQGALVAIGAITDHADADALHVDVAATAATAGDVRVDGQLFAGDELVGDVSTTRHVTAGAQSIGLSFDGEAIAAAGVDGPYQVYLSIADELYAENAEHTTAAYAASSFRQPPASFAGATTDAAVDTNGDATNERLDVTAPLRARVEGSYELRGTLRDGDGDLVASDEAEAALTATAQDVTLSFDGTAIADHGEDGPYDVELVVVDGDGEAVVERDHATAAYAHTSFAAPSASFEDFDDEGVDSNGDGLFETLRVTAGVSVTEAGTYAVTGSLNAPDGTYIASASAEATLSPGSGSVSLAFDGAAIRASEADGPYQVRGLELTRAGAAVDAVTGGVATGAFAHTAFQGAGATPNGAIVDRTEDGDGDGRINTLAIDIPVSVGASDSYGYNAQLVDSTGEEIVWASGSAFLSLGQPDAHAALRRPLHLRQRRRRATARAQPLDLLVHAHVHGARRAHDRVLRGERVRARGRRHRARHA